ncbi:MAG: NADH-quinone oxidoreductase subunit F [Dehalococcoidia bacterium]|nr:NADH-quinone oxidoreductase subunit F [Dehalococcoidia bacterium]
MTEAYQALKQEADRRWQTLAQGERSWIRVGTAICGRSVGAVEVIYALQEELRRARPERISAVVSPVGCLGLCYAEPIVDIKLPGGPRVLYRNVSPERVPALVEAALVKGEVLSDLVLGTLDGKIEGVPEMTDLAPWRMQTRVALRNAGHIDPHDILQYIANGGYEALDKALSGMTPQQVAQEVTTSGLRGRGGAFFPTGTKWGFLTGSRGPIKYILCNCEEGDPGAYNDKGILESDPNTVIEGIILAGYATGASNGIVFIRHGNEGPISRTGRAIAQAYEMGLLGKNILGSGFSFDIEVSLVGESYVSGEETALMEAIEGKRAMPRARPPFPAAVGVWGKPSNINNVKTLAYVPEVIRKGGQWFSAIGVNRSKGTAILCLSGHIAHRGMYEVALGITLRDVMEKLGGGIPDGRKVKILQTGGPLGGVLSADKLDTPVDFEAMAAAGAILGSGGIIYGDETVCAVDLTRNLIAFCQFESCGKCFPCRLGMTHLLDIIERIRSGQGRRDDLDLMRRYGETMQAGSMCGHGQLGFNPVRSALTFFMEDFRVHLEEGRCPTGSCQQMVANPTRTRPGPEAYTVIAHPYGARG